MFSAVVCRFPPSSAPLHPYGLSLASDQLGFLGVPEGNHGLMPGRQLPGRRPHRRRERTQERGKVGKSIEGIIRSWLVTAKQMITYWTFRFSAWHRLRQVFLQQPGGDAELSKRRCTACRHVSIADRSTKKDKTCPCRWPRTWPRVIMSEAS